MNALLAGSWKTTACGILAATGLYLVSDAQPGDVWLKRIGNILSIVGTAGMGLAARDNNKTSAQVGAEKKDPPCPLPVP